MGWFGDDSQQANSYSQVQDPNFDGSSYNNQPDTAHELIAGAASYEAAKAYENHCAANGDPGSHAEAKELVAGFAGAAVDRFAETKGMDFIDREKAKREAAQQCQDNIDPNQWN